ncbi:hypothetical protein L7F22_044187 [Adiantum nelumboides]|nr:hypothetical protein [Adiantum nelumboides]
MTLSPHTSSRFASIQSEQYPNNNSDNLNNLPCVPSSPKKVNQGLYSHASEYRHPSHVQHSNSMPNEEASSSSAAVDAEKPMGRPFYARQRSTSSSVLNDGHSRRPVTPSGTSDTQAGEGVTAYHYAAVQQITENRENIEYILHIREQPKHSRMCGVGEKADRRPIDPAPIIQLRVVTHEFPKGGTNSTTKEDDKSSEIPISEPLRDAKSSIVNSQPSNLPPKRNMIRRGVPVKTEWGEGWEDKAWYLENPYYFMYAMLADAETDDELHLLSDGKTRYTTGSCVSCLYHLKDIDQSEQGFFVFPDLSIRVEGRYRLKLCLFETIGHEVHHCKSIYSKPFNVYTAKRFPGMEESTQLSRSFADQGLKVRVRKNPRARRARASGKRKELGGSDEDSDGDMYPSRRPSAGVMDVNATEDRERGGMAKRIKSDGSVGALPPSQASYGINPINDGRRPPPPFSPHDTRPPVHPGYGYSNEAGPQPPPPPPTGTMHGASARDIEMERREAEAYRPYMPRRPSAGHPGMPPEGGQGCLMTLANHERYYAAGRHGPPPVDDRVPYGAQPGYADPRDVAERRYASGPPPPRSEQEMYEREREAAFHREQESYHHRRAAAAAQGAPPLPGHHGRPPSPRRPEYGTGYAAAPPPPQLGGERGGSDGYAHRYEGRDVRSTSGAVGYAADARHRLPPLHVALSPNASPQQARSMAAGPQTRLPSGAGYGSGGGAPMLPSEQDQRGLPPPQSSSSPYYTHYPQQRYPPPPPQQQHLHPSSQSGVGAGGGMNTPPIRSPVDSIASARPYAGEHGPPPPSTQRHTGLPPPPPSQSPAHSHQQSRMPPPPPSQYGRRQ